MTDDRSDEWASVLGSRYGVRWDVPAGDPWRWGKMFSTAELADAHRESLPDGSAGKSMTRTVKVRYAGQCAFEIISQDADAFELDNDRFGDVPVDLIPGALITCGHYTGLNGVTELDDAYCGRDAGHTGAHGEWEF